MRKCVICCRTRTYLIEGKRQQWYYFDNTKDRYLCSKCYQRVIHQPVYYKKHYKRIRQQQSDYYYRVTKHKLEARKKQLIELETQKV